MNAEHKLEDHPHHNHGGHHHGTDEISDVSLATSATLHCLMGCGLGELVGMLIAMAVGLAVVPSIVLAVSLGFVFGIILGMRPLLKHGYSFYNAFKQVLIVERLSIVFMETAEVLVEVYTTQDFVFNLEEQSMWDLATKSFGIDMSEFSGFGGSA
jgi:hypothetical protein